MKTTDDTRSRVLHAAGVIFAEKGFQAATVREICQTAGVNLASVNYHFGDKQRLYAETVQHAYQLTAQQVPTPDWPPGTPPGDKLTDFVRMLITRMIGVSRAPWQTRLMMREVLQPTEACKQLVERYFRPHFELLLGILDEILPADAPLAKRQQVAFSIVGQCLFYRVADGVVALLVPEEQRGQDYTHSALAEHIAELSLAALGVSKAIGTEPGNKEQQ